MDLSNDPGPSMVVASNNEQPSSATYPGPSLSDAFADEPSILMSSDDSDPAPSSALAHPKANSVPSISTYPISTSPPTSPLHPSSIHSSPESESLTPLTSLSPSPSPSPGHDQHASLGPAPHGESLPMSISIDVPSAPDTLLQPSASTSQQSLPLQPIPSSPSHPSPLALASALENLIPFDAFTPSFDSAMSLQLDAHQGDANESQPESHASASQLQEHYAHTLTHTPQQLPQQLHYIPPPPVLARDREVNIWKLACQERVDYVYVSFLRPPVPCLTCHSFRRYGIETIKAVVASEASYATPDAHSDSPSPSPQSPQTRFRLYTPASYTLDSGPASNSGSTSKARPLDDSDQDAEGEAEEVEPDMDAEADMDVDMDDDDDDYDDDDDLGECDADAEGEGEVELGAQAEGLADATESAKVSDGKGEMVMVMDVDCSQGEADKENDTSVPVSAPATPQPPQSTPLLSDSADLPAASGNILAMPIPPAFALPLRPQLPSLSSLHVPLLSEPPRAFMGRGTPPDPRRRVEWSISGQYPGCQTDGIGVGLYLSAHTLETGSSQRGTGDESVGIVTLPVQIMHTDTVHEHDHLQAENRQPQQSHQHAGEWTSFLYAMLEGSDMNVCHTGAGIPSSAIPGSTSANMTTGTTQAADWYELGLGSVHMNGVAAGVSGEMPLSHHHPVDDASSSTLRFALG